MKTIEVHIEGISPLLIHRFGEDAEGAGATRPTLVRAEDPREVARKNAYIANDGTFYFSAFAIPNAMGSAGSNHKLRGGRKTLRFVVPSAVSVTTDTITILRLDGKPYRGEEFEVDSRPISIPSTKGRVLRHRPRWNEWGARFELMIEEGLLPIDMAHRILGEAGVQIGIGDFRPEKRGPFGRFRVTKFS